MKEGDKRAHELNDLIDELLQEGQSWLKPKSSVSIFPAQSDGQNIVIYDPEDHTRVIERFTFLDKERPLSYFRRLFAPNWR